MQNRRTMLRTMLGLAAAGSIQDARLPAEEPTARKEQSTESGRDYWVQHLLPGSVGFHPGKPQTISRASISLAIDGTCLLTSKGFRGHAFFLADGSGNPKADPEAKVNHVANIICNGDKTSIAVYFNEDEVGYSTCGYIRLPAMPDETISSAAARVAAVRNAIRKAVS